MAASKRPRALLFDIGGVCVVSPFQAILDYEKANNIPPGWVNFSLSRHSPNGNFHRLERGEIKMDAEFFSGFTRDLQDPELWKQFHERLRQKDGASGKERRAEIPPLPKIDGEYLFWEMMGRSRVKDPYIYPALCKLKASGQFLIGALSNTVIFPEGHPYNDNERDGLRAQFDFFVSSAHVGLRKPDSRVYELALKEMKELAARRGLEGFKADDIVFLDDIGENLKGAKNAGMRTLKVVLGKTQDSVRELEKLTGLQLLEGEDKARL